MFLKSTVSGTYLYGLRVEFESFLLIDQKFLDILALIPLELDHLAHLTVVDDGAIASCDPGLAKTNPRALGMSRSTRTELLLNDLEDFLLIELFRETLDSGQGLATIALCEHTSVVCRTNK